MIDVMIQGFKRVYRGNFEPFVESVELVVVPKRLTPIDSDTYAKMDEWVKRCAKLTLSDMYGIDFLHKIHLLSDKQIEALQAVLHAKLALRRRQKNLQETESEHALRIEEFSKLL